MAGEADAIAAVDRPATVASLTADLARLGVMAGDVLIVHSSLSALGWVAGGAQSVVAALLAAVGSGGTIVMPAQSGQLSDPAGWEDPAIPAEWVPTVRDALPAFDPRLTPTRGMGAIVEAFRDHPDAVRSGHPINSFVAVGESARAIVDAQQLTPSFGDPSPLSVLYDLDASVLLLGVGHGNDTSLHLAEYRARYPGKATIRIGVPLRVERETRWTEYEDLDLDEGDFDAIGDAFDATGRERRGAIGAGRGRLSRQRELVDFAVAWMEANRRHRPA